MSKNKNLNPFNDVQYEIDNEGLDYCFEDYSTWENINDEEFHYLRLAYLTAARNLRDYVESQVDEDE